MEEQKSGNQVCTSRQKVDFWCNVKKRISDVALKSSGERCVSLAFLHCVFEKTFKKPQWRKAKNGDLGIRGLWTPRSGGRLMQITLMLSCTMVTPARTVYHPPNYVRCIHKPQDKSVFCQKNLHNSDQMNCLSCRLHSCYPAQPAVLMLCEFS